MTSKLISKKLEKPYRKMDCSQIQIERKLCRTASKIIKTKYINNSFDILCINNLIFTEKCRIVARFKDYLINDDETEFLRRFYKRVEVTKRLKQMFYFYENYCKIFPNYMILTENVYLYKNIRKKQKMIDQFNLIQKEEEENRLLMLSNKNKSKNVIFDEEVMRSIDKCQPSMASSVLSKSFSMSNSKTLINISIINRNPLTYFETNDSESIYNYEKNINDILNEESNYFTYHVDDKDYICNSKDSSLIRMISVMDHKKCDKIDLTSKLDNSNESKKKRKIIKKLSPVNKDNNNRIKQKNENQQIKGKKFILHKPTCSVPGPELLKTKNDLENKTMKIINNFNNIIIGNNNKDGMVININNNYYQLSNKNNSKIKSHFEKQKFNSNFKALKTENLNSMTFKCEKKNLFEKSIQNRNSLNKQLNIDKENSKNRKIIYKKILETEKIKSHTKGVYSSGEFFNLSKQNENLTKLLKVSKNKNSKKSKDSTFRRFENYKLTHRVTHLKSNTVINTEESLGITNTRLRRNLEKKMITDYSSNFIKKAKKSDTKEKRKKYIFLIEKNKIIHNSFEISRKGRRMNNKHFITVNNLLSNNSNFLKENNSANKININDNLKNKKLDTSPKDLKNIYSNNSKKLLKTKTPTKENLIYGYGIKTENLNEKSSNLKTYNYIHKNENKSTNYNTSSLMNEKKVFTNNQKIKIYKKNNNLS